jgi:hypothetical protein
MLQVCFAVACGDHDTPIEPDPPAFAASSCELGLSADDSRFLIEILLLSVDNLETSGVLSSGQANALRGHLENVLSAIDAGKYCSAQAKLGAVRDQVANLVENGVLTEEEAGSFINIVELILEGQPNLVTVDQPSSAAGVYGAASAAFGPEPTLAGVAGAIVLVNDGGVRPTEGCGPLIGFPAGAIALVDRGFCLFETKALNAEAAGAVAVIVVNSTTGPATGMGGDALLTIPSVMVSLADGSVIKAGLPATGRVSRAP